MKTMTNHTPGEWVIADDGEQPTSVYVQGEREDGSKNIIIAQMETGFYAPTMFEERQANAQLIAAAPELLEALKRCAPWMARLIADGVYENCAMPNDAVQTYNMLNDVISKAEGHV